MWSFVKFAFKPLALQGHLSASGVYYSIDEDKTGIIWQQIWTDFESTQPSRQQEIDKHWLPSLIQPIGISLSLSLYDALFIVDVQILIPTSISTSLSIYIYI